MLGYIIILIVALVLIVLLIRIKSARNSKIVLILKSIYNIKAVLQAISKTKK